MIENRIPIFTSQLQVNFVTISCSKSGGMSITDVIQYIIEWERESSDWVAEFATVIYRSLL